jgi:hypothetical protein
MEPQGLCVIWSSADPDVAFGVALMYAHNAKIKGWWDRVRLVVWGPSARLLAENEDLQAEIQACQKDGVEVLACRACADMFNVADRLSGLGIEVIYMGKPLTDMLKTGWATLSF